MRIIFLYECRYRNDGPPLFLCKSMQWHMGLLGLTGVENKIPEGDHRRWGEAELFVWVDHGEDALGTPKFTCPKPNAYWVSDSHLGMEYRLEKAKEFDHVFVAIPEHIDRFKEAVGHDNVHWLPHAGEPTCYKKIETIKKYDVCFIGHLPGEERVDLLDALFSAVPDFFYGQRFFEEANEKYNQSKIVFNHSIGGEANMRVFEATLSGSMCLTSYSEAVEKLGYEHGKNIVYYTDGEDLVERAMYYLEHEDEREAIAAAGRKHTLENHTYLHRAAQMLDTVFDRKTDTEAIVKSHKFAEEQYRAFNRAVAMTIDKDTLIAERKRLPAGAF
jgi:hypothetical protein